MTKKSPAPAPIPARAAASASLPQKGQRPLATRPPVSRLLKATATAAVAAAAGRRGANGGPSGPAAAPSPLESPSILSTGSSNSSVGGGGGGGGRWEGQLSAAEGRRAGAGEEASVNASGYEANPGWNVPIVPLNIPILLRSAQRAGAGPVRG